MSDDYQESCPSIEEELDYYKRTLAAINAQREQEVRELTSQLLAAQTVNGRMREALEDIEYSYNPSKANQIARKALSLTPDPTLLDEVVKVVDELLGAMYRYAVDVDDSPTIEHRLMCHRAEQLLSRLRQSTRETEEK